VQLDESLAPPLAITTVVSLLFLSVYVLLTLVGEQKSCHIRMTGIFIDNLLVKQASFFKHDPAKPEIPPKRMQGTKWVVVWKYMLHS
jgi:hypothetical protein